MTPPPPLVNAIRRPVYARMWTSYLSALHLRPIRTRTMTGTGLFFMGDVIAQFVVEKREVDLDRIGEKGVWDPARTARMAIYGVIFAPLAHGWLTTMSRFTLSTPVKTTTMRMAADSLIWSPFVCALFPTTMGLLEGRHPREIKEKISDLWFPTYLRAQCVFGPTQLINYTLVPPAHRLLVLQGVGLCWNIYLSYANARNNSLLDAEATERKL